MVASRNILRALFSVVMLGMIAACASSYQSSGPVGLGKPITENQIRLWNIDISPNGNGLPEGSGTAIIGEMLYQQQCASCHGDKGQGGIANRLAGGGGLNTTTPIKTVGSFWPYPTTIFDYTRRAMPHKAPQSLSNDQLYAATAYILFLNKIIAKDTVMDAKSLPLVQMPNRDGFIPIER